MIFLGKGKFIIYDKAPLFVALPNTLEEGVGYSFFPKGKSNKKTKVNEIVIYNSKLVSNIMLRKVFVKLNKVMDDIEDADEDGTRYKTAFNKAYKLKMELLSQKGIKLNQDSFDSILVQIDEIIKALDNPSEVKTK